MKPRFFKLAMHAANKSKDKFRVGAVVVDKRKNVLSVGVNDMRKSHPKSLNKAFPYLHAELDALAGLSEDETKGGSIYVFRSTKAGRLAKSKPCICCHELIRRYGIRFIHYTDETGYHTLEVA